jgi:hypothetical protein
MAQRGRDEREALLLGIRKLMAGLGLPDCGSAFIKEMYTHESQLFGLRSIYRSR